MFLHFVSVYKIFPNSLQSVFLGELSCKVRIPCFRCIFQPLIILRIAQIPFGRFFIWVQRTLIALVHSLLCTVKFLHDLFILRLQLIRSAGHDLNWSEVDGDLLMIATMQAAQGVTDLLRQVLGEAIK